MEKRSHVDTDGYNNYIDDIIGGGESALGSCLTLPCEKV